MSDKRQILIGVIGERRAISKAILQLLFENNVELLICDKDIHAVPTVPGMRQVPDIGDYFNEYDNPSPLSEVMP